MREALKGSQAANRSEEVSYLFHTAKAAVGKTPARLKRPEKFLFPPPARHFPFTSASPFKFQLQVRLTAVQGNTASCSPTVDYKIGSRVGFLAEYEWAEQVTMA